MSKAKEICFQHHVRKHNVRNRALKIASEEPQTLMVVGMDKDEDTEESEEEIVGDAASSGSLGALAADDANRDGSGGGDAASDKPINIKNALNVKNSRDGRSSCKTHFGVQI